MEQLAPHVLLHHGLPSIPLPPASSLAAYLLSPQQHFWKINTSWPSSPPPNASCFPSSPSAGPLKPTSLPLICGPSHLHLPWGSPGCMGAEFPGKPSTLTVGQGFSRLVPISGSLGIKNPCPRGPLIPSEDLPPRALGMAPASGFSVLEGYSGRSLPCLFGWWPCESSSPGQAPGTVYLSPPSVLPLLPLPLVRG